LGGRGRGLARLLDLARGRALVVPGRRPPAPAAWPRRAAHTLVQPGTLARRDPLHLRLPGRSGARRVRCQSREPERLRAGRRAGPLRPVRPCRRRAAGPAMTTIRASAVAVALALAPLRSWGQTDLTIEEAIRTAWTNNASLQAGDALVNASREGALAARDARLPT